MSMAQTFPASHTFLKWEDPQVMAPDESIPTDLTDPEELKKSLFHTSDHRFIPDPRLIEYVAEYKKCTRKAGVPWKNNRDFLDILFPTKYWTERGVLHKQKVSLEQCTREELKAISDRLDDQLMHRQSQSSTGFCPVRYALHMELFDELIRQVSLTSPARAYLLDRVRGELFQTIDSYRKVLDVSLVEESKLPDPDYVDPEYQLLQGKLDIAEAELNAASEEYNNVLSDFKDVENKYELFERIKTQLHEPEILFTQKLNDALVRQIYHFENPPIFDGDEEEMMEI